MRLPWRLPSVGEEGLIEHFTCESYTQSPMLIVLFAGRQSDMHPLRTSAAGGMLWKLPAARKSTLVRPQFALSDGCQLAGRVVAA